MGSVDVVDPEIQRTMDDLGGGRIVAPVGTLEGQRLIRVTRDGETFREDFLMDVRYVPLIGEEGFPEGP